MTGILAHRGFSALYPENTMLAFKEAANFDIVGFETDVQMSKDGVLVICHDEEISRVSNGQGFVKDFTFEELRKLDFRNGMDQYELDEDTRIPSLEEFFEWFKETNFIINIELKSSQERYDGMVEKTLDMVKKYGLVDRVIMSSFNHRDIIKCKGLIPEIKCGFLTWSVFLKPGSYTASYGIDYYHPDYNSIDDEDYEDCKKNNIDVNPYTIDDKEKMKELVDKGVLYIITNRPDLGVEVVGGKNE